MNVHILWLIATEFEASRIFPEEKMREGKISHLSKDHSLLISGPGPINAALAIKNIAELQGKYADLRIINLGICAAPDEAVSPGSLFMPGDFLMRGGEQKGVLPQLMDQCYPRMEYLWEEDDDDPVYCLTLPAPLRDASQAGKLPAEFPRGVVLVDMEAYSYIRVCQTLGVVFLSVKAVSDHGRPQPKNEFMDSAECALGVLKQFVQLVISSEVPDSPRLLWQLLQQNIKRISQS